MPIFGYFVVVGVVLYGALVLLSSQLESESLPVSQTIGLPTPFKASSAADGLSRSNHAAVQ
jgi:hypothetical protein